MHYNLVKNPDYSSFCDINATVSCKAAYLSRYGSVAGVPVAVGGILFFTWVLLLMWGSRGKSRIQDSAPAYIFAGSTLGARRPLYLAYASFFILKEVCPLCVATYVAVIGVFVISGGASSVPMSKLPARALKDIRVLVATPVALVIALLFIAGASWGMSVFPRETERPVIAQAPPLTAERTEFERWWDVQPKSPNFPYASDGAKVQIVEFADFQCPHCKQMYFAYKPILDKYLAEHPNDVKLIFKTWPINANCNAGRARHQLRRVLRRLGGVPHGEAERHRGQAEGLVLRAPGGIEPRPRSAAPRPTSARSPTSTRSIRR